MLDGSVNFSLEIEKRAKGKNSSYMDAVMDVCDAFEIEPQSIAKHLNRTIIEKIRIEAQELNLIRSKTKDRGSKLPL